jgi:hypothetical protein
MNMGKPTVLHTEDSSGRLCGLERTDSQSWPDKYLNDEFAQTLPPCQGCLDETIRRGWEVLDVWKDTEMVQPSAKPNLLGMTTRYEPEPLVVAQSGGILQSSDEQMSLREWCE